jgi:Mrp family chromosome partitioning ATPase
MAKAQKVKLVTEAEIAPLALALADGTELVTFPPSVAGEIRAMVTRMRATQPLPQRLALLASLRQEGATYLTQILGAVIAGDLRRRVCVVELNWHWPALGQPGKPEGAPAKGEAPPPPEPVAPGLAGVLAGTASLDEALLATNIEGLKLLPAGPMAPELRPVMARGEPLAEQLQALSEQFDHLLLDVPAVLATSDAISLAALADACILAVRQGATPRQVVMRALDDVKHLNMQGVMMNRVRINTPKLIRGLVPQH